MEASLLCRGQCVNVVIVQSLLSVVVFSFLGCRAILSGPAGGVVSFFDVTMSMKSHG